MARHPGRFFWGTRDWTSELCIGCIHTLVHQELQTMLSACLTAVIPDHCIYRISWTLSVAVLSWQTSFCPWTSIECLCKGPCKAAFPTTTCFATANNQWHLILGCLWLCSKQADALNAEPARQNRQTPESPKRMHLVFLMSHGIQMLDWGFSLILDLTVIVNLKVSAWICILEHYFFSRLCPQSHCNTLWRQIWSRFLKPVQSLHLSEMKIAVGFHPLSYVSNSHAWPVEYLCKGVLMKLTVTLAKHPA